MMQFSLKKNNQTMKHIQLFEDFLFENEVEIEKLVSAYINKDRRNSLDRGRWSSLKTWQRSIKQILLK